MGHGFFIRPYSGSDLQKWKLQSVGDGYYIIINKYNNWALTGDEDEYSTWAGFRSYTGTDLQKWQI